MKLLFLSKRSPMGRDLMTRPYGRFYYLPRSLAGRGHDVTILLLDYRKGAPVDMRRDGIRWVSESLVFGSPLNYIRKLKGLLQETRPDWIVGCSDTYYGILARYWGQRYGIRSCIDAYDNYESYLPWMKPLHGLWRRALSRADLVTAAGPDLAAYMSQQRHGRPAVVVPMAADPIGFRPMDQAECRSRMGLPHTGRFVGYCGSVHKNRGVEVLFDACSRLKQKHPDVELLLSGRSWGNVPIPDAARVLGYVDDEKMPVLLNCMDVLTVINRASSFGNYSYPAKLYEAMMCNIPVVATATPATRWILEDHGDFLVPPSDPEQLCARLEQSLNLDRVAYERVTDWEMACDMLERALQDAE
ncbi:MAG: glycosyltransferase [Gammaproteobacteria bacterium]